MGLEGITMVAVELEGVSPLLMHNIRLANPFDEYTRAIKAITGKKNNKTETDMEELMHLEFLAGIYYHPDHGVYVPGTWVEGCLKSTAKTFKKGKDVERGLMVDEEACSLKYDGPRTPEQLWDKGGFFDYRAIAIGKKKTMRVRPRFAKWGLAATLLIVNEVLNVEDVKHFLELGGRITGMGDYRPRFGRYIVKSFEAA